MSCSLRFRRAARDELREAYRWYEGRLPGLGQQFLDAVEAVFERIRKNPESFPVTYRDAVRKAPVGKFPYVDRFYLRGDVAVVLAVLHGRRDPGEWQRRYDRET